MGTTRYGYTAAGLLAWEDGPWENDTVSYTHTNRLRASLSLVPPGARAGGRRVLQERHSNPQLSTNPIQTVTYTRGLDLSGTLAGAGGIGGLLARTETSSLASRTAYFHSDGNGNVTTLTDSNAAVVARYLYDPFGDVLALSGPQAEANLYRFSGKEQHPASGLIYYGYRFYDPGLQRWPNRDPIGERGGRNLYGFVYNNPANLIDSDGRAPMGWPVVPPPGYPPSIPPKPPSDTSIRKCNRKIENPSNDFVIGCANLRGHDYFDWPDGDGGRDGVGYPGHGTLPTSEAGSQPRSCRPCYKSNSPLKYGTGAGKAGTSASDDDIKDCLKNRPFQGNYHGLCNNCNDWASGAAKDCGLSCP